MSISLMQDKRLFYLALTGAVIFLPIFFVGIGIAWMFSKDAGKIGRDKFARAILKGGAGF